MSCWLPVFRFMSLSLVMQQAIAMTSLAEPEPLGWLVPLFAITFLDNPYLSYHPFGLDQTHGTQARYKGPSCPVDDAVTVVDPAYHRQTLKVSLPGGHFWQSTGYSEPRELQPPHQPQPLKYIDPDGSCHEHWIIPGVSRQAAGTPDIDPEEPDNSTLLPWLDDEPTFSVPFNITRPDNNDHDLEVAGNPLARHVPDPLLIQPPDTKMPAPLQLAIWLHDDPEQALLLIPSEFPVLTPIPTAARDNSDQLISGAFLSFNTGKPVLQSQSFSKEGACERQCQNDNLLLMLLSLVYGAALSVKDHNGETFYIVQLDNGHLFRISASAAQSWFRMFNQALLESLYPEIFGPFLPAGGGWHQWNRYVRKVPGNKGKRSKKKGRRRDRGSQEQEQPVQQPHRPDRIDRDQATGQPSPVQMQSEPTHREATEKEAANGRKTDNQKAAGSHTVEKVMEQLKQAEELYREKEYDQCIGVLIRAHFRMDSAGISRAHEHWTWLKSILNDAIYKKMHDQVMAMAKRDEHEQALRHLRPLKLIPIELLSERHIGNMESAAHFSGNYIQRPAIDSLYLRLKKEEKDLALIRQSAVEIYFEHRLVMSEEHWKGLVIAWCQTLRPLLGHVKRLLAANTPKEAFNQIGPHVIKFVDMLDTETTASKGTLSWVRGMLEDIISGTLTVLEQKPESSSQIFEFHMEWVLSRARDNRLVNKKPLKVFRERLEALQLPRTVSVQQQYSVRFTPLYEHGQSRSGTVELHQQSVLALLKEVDRYLEQGMFGKAMGLIIAIHKVTKGALPNNTKARLYSQLSSAAYPLLYDLMVEVSANGRSEGSQKVFNELRTNLGELELQLASSQSHAMFWLKRQFLAQPLPEAQPAPAPAPPPWLAAIEGALSTASYRELLTILQEAGVNPNSKTLSPSVRAQLREVVHQVIATLSDLIQQGLADTHNTTVDEQLTLLGELVAYIDASPEVTVESLLERRQELVASQRQLDSITTLIDQGQWLQCVELMNNGNTAPEEHLGQWHSAAQQLVSGILAASQLAEGQNELSQALALLKTASLLEAPVSEDTKGQMQNLWQRLLYSQTVQQRLSEVTIARSSSTTAALQLLLQQQAVEQAAVSPATWQMLVEEVSTTAQLLIGLLEQNLNQSQLDEAGALLAQLQQLQTLYPDALNPLQANIETLSASHKDLETQLAEMNEELERMSQTSTVATALETMESLIHLYPQALLATRATLIDELLKKIIQQMKMGILRNSSDQRRWNLTMESLATLSQLLTTHPTLALPGSSAIFQEVEKKAWENFYATFNLSNMCNVFVFVKKEGAKLLASSEATFYFARKETRYKFLARRLYRLLSEKTSDPETKATCQKGIDRIDARAE